MPKADVDINIKARAEQAVGKLKAVSKELKAAATAADGAGALPTQTAAPAIGKAIGKAAVGYISSEALGTLSSYVGSRQGGSRLANRISGVGSSAIAGATAGAVAGSVIPGVGTAVGAAVGAIAGAVTGFVRTMAEETRNFREACNALSSAHIATANAQTLGMRDRAFERLQSVRTRPEQESELRSRLQTLRFGSGANSIRNLQSRILKAEEAGETDNADYLNDKDLFARQKGREAAMMRQLEELRIPAFASFVRAGEVGDAVGAMGGKVGAQVDVADVNRSQLEVIKQILEKLSAPGREAADAATPRSTIIAYQ
ncbi:MAG: hypothetical protein ACI4W7_02635 [Candidatus Spyradenecus sp.]